VAVPSPTAGWQRFLTVTASLVLTVWFLRWAEPVLVPLVIAILITLILTPPMLALQRRGLGRTPAALSVLGTAVLLVSGTLALVVVQIGSLATELPKHEQAILDKVTALQNALGAGDDAPNGRRPWYHQLGETIRIVTERIQGGRKPPAPGEQEPVPVRVESPGLAESVLHGAGPVAEAAIHGVLVVALVAFMLIQREQLRNRVIRLMAGGGTLPGMTRAVDDGVRRISRFLLMQFLVNFGFGLALTIGAAVIGIPYALLWGVLATLLRYVPYVGALVTFVVVVGINLIIVPGWTGPLLLLAWLIVLELLSSNVAEPILFGHSIGASEVALLVAALFWAWLWGPIGLMLSAPLTACLVVLGRYVPQLAFFDVLLGDRQVLERHVTLYQRLLARDKYEAADLLEAYAKETSAAKASGDLLIPALALAQQSRVRNELTDDDVGYVYATGQELLGEVLPSPAGPAAAERGSGLQLLGCPARDDGDELALEAVFRQPAFDNYRWEVASEKLLFAEVKTRIEEARPAVLVIATLSEAGVPYIRYLCKRLQGITQRPKVVVGCWGLGPAAAGIAEQLRAAGADVVGTSPEATVRELAPLLQIAAGAEDELVAVN